MNRIRKYWPITFVLLYLFIASTVVRSDTTTLTNAVPGTTILASTFNKITSAFQVDHVPRNTSNVATAEGGSLGSSTYPWSQVYVGPVSAAVSLDENSGSALIKVGGVGRLSVSSTGLSLTSLADGLITYAKLNDNAKYVLRTVAFTATDNWVVPTGVTYLLVEGCGAGGGGGGGGGGATGANSGSGGSGGGGGPWQMKGATTSAGSVIVVTITSGGNGGAAGDNTGTNGSGGNNGGSSSFVSSTGPAISIEFKGGGGGLAGTGNSTGASPAGGVRNDTFVFAPFGGAGGASVVGAGGTGVTGMDSVAAEGGAGGTGGATHGSGGGGGGGGHYGNGGAGGNGNNAGDDGAPGDNAGNNTCGGGGGGAGGRDTNAGGSGGTGGNGYIRVHFTAPI